MRPIDKGNIPLDKNGNIKRVKDHKDWRKDLIDRIGDYCVYCELKLTVSPQVEHVIAANIASALKLTWENLLLACRPCNGAKSDKPCPPTTHYLPDMHNTYLAFQLNFQFNPKQDNEEGAFITYSSTLDANQKVKAQNTIELCALDEDTTNKRYPDRVTDLRWKERYSAYREANELRTDWDEWGNTMKDKFIKLLMKVALGKGFFSIWFYKFDDVPEIKKALVESFPGTAKNCFDISNDYNPIWRNLPNDI